MVDIIEEYIELCIKRDELLNRVEEEKAEYNYAKVEGDLAYENSDYESESRYNRSLNDHMDREKEANSRLDEIVSLMQKVSQRYKETINLMTRNDFAEVIKILLSKKSREEEKIRVITLRRNEAVLNGNNAFSNGNYKEERRYDNIVLECDTELKEIEKKPIYYGKFIEELSSYANNLNRTQDDSDYSRRNR